MKTRAPKKEIGGKWVFVEEDPVEAAEADRDDVIMMLSLRGQFIATSPDRSDCNPFAALDQYRDYFPGENEVPPEGAWILIKSSPLTPYTVPPLSIWFAEPWPMDPPDTGRKKQRPRPQPKRVKIVTPHGELGLFPREFSIVRDPGAYYPFLGEGMTLRFFSAPAGAGIPEVALFYLRSRGVAKADAIAMLIGQIRGHGVCWIETDRSVAEAFVRDGEWPDEDRLATRTPEPDPKARQS